MEETKNRLVRRHLENWGEDKVDRWGGGDDGTDDDEAAARRKAEFNDMRNAVCVRTMSRENADLIIRNDDTRR